MDNRYRSFIVQLSALDAGSLARLRRDAGRPMERGRSFGMFFQCFTNDVPSDDSVLEDYFLIATLFPFDREFQKLKPAQWRNENFGRTLARVRQERIRVGHMRDDAYTSFDRRVEVLLDARRSQFASRLAPMVQFITAQRLTIDWVRLLEDVRRWTTERDQVRMSWTKGYFVGNKHTKE